MAAPARFRVRLSNGQEYGPGGMDVIVQWAREGRVPRDSLLVNVETNEVKSALSEPELAKFILAPPTVAGPVRSADGGPLAGVIPYRNPPALAGYYIGIFSWIPLLGALLGPLAIVLGIVGLRKRAKDPSSRGAAHAWIAIAAGLLGLAISAGFILITYFATL